MKIKESAGVMGFMACFVVGGFAFIGGALFGAMMCVNKIDELEARIRDLKNARG